MMRGDVRLACLVLVLHVSGHAARGCAGKSMMARVMTGYTADQRTPDAPFRVDGRSRHESHRDCECEGRRKDTHVDSPKKLAAVERWIATIGSD